MSNQIRKGRTHGRKVFIGNKGSDSDDATRQEEFLTSIRGASLSLDVPYLNRKRPMTGVGPQSFTVGLKLVTKISKLLSIVGVASMLCHPVWSPR